MNIPDDRFKWLCDLFHPKSEVPAFLEIVDIAGLVRSAFARTSFDAPACRLRSRLRRLSRSSSPERKHAIGQALIALPYSTCQHTCYYCRNTSDVVGEAARLEALPDILNLWAPALAHMSKLEVAGARRRARGWATPS